MEKEKELLRNKFEKETGEWYISDSNEACGEYSDEYVDWLESIVLANGHHTSNEKALNLACVIKAEGEPLLDEKYITVKVKVGSMIIAPEDAKRISNGL